MTVTYREFLNVALFKRNNEYSLETEYQDYTKEDEAELNLRCAIAFGCEFYEILKKFADKVNLKIDSENIGNYIFGNYGTLLKSMTCKIFNKYYSWYDADWDGFRRDILYQEMLDGLEVEL